VLDNSGIDEIYVTWATSYRPSTSKSMPLGVSVLSFSSLPVAAR
jgi:hypothetical protein